MIVTSELVVFGVSEDVEARVKMSVFGMQKRGDMVYTQIVRNCSVIERISIIKDKADTGAVIYSDGFRTY